MADVRAEVLDFSVPVYPNSSSNTLVGQYPFFANTRLVPSEQAPDGEVRTLYYGDEVDIGFWSLLGVRIGTRTDTDHTYTREDGFVYRYNRGAGTFKIYDASSTVVYSVTGVKSIADMHIDFTVYKSHQFEIIVSIDDLYRFFIIAKLVKKTYGQSPIAFGGLRNRTKGTHYDGKNLEQFLYRLIEIPEFFDRITSSPTEIVITYGGKFTSILPSQLSDMLLRIQPISDLVQEAPKPIVAYHVKDTFKARMLVMEKVFSTLNITMHPSLQGIIRNGETNNSRAIYEPWLIYAIKFLWMQRVEDDTSFDIDIFDLSPNWGY